MRKTKEFRFDNDRPIESFKGILQFLLQGYRFNVKGLYMDDSSIYPLPREASVVGKVIETTIIEYVYRRLLTIPELQAQKASSDRVYPDLTFSGALIDPRRFALDVKCARRAEGGKKTQSAITIGTFDAEYFRYPDEKAGNIMAPYSSYAAHLTLLALYDYVETTAQNIEILVVEKWRVATKKRASGTRSYIAARQDIELLRKERGDFDSEEEFNNFWRAQPINKSKEERWRLRREQAARKQMRLPSPGLPISDE